MQILLLDRTVPITSSQEEHIKRHQKSQGVFVSSYLWYLSQHAIHTGEKNAVLEAQILQADVGLGDINLTVINFTRSLLIWAVFCPSISQARK